MKNKVFAMRPIVAVLISAMALQGCATHNLKGEKLTPGESFKQTFASEEPCSNNARNIGMLVGVTAGGLLGSQTGGNNRQMATVIGMAAGAGIGALIGASFDSRRCELFKIQQKYALDMQVVPIAVSANTVASAGNGASKASEPEKVGFSVSVVDQTGKPQFLSGSSSLQSDAMVHFTEIAKQYSVEQTVLQSGASTNEAKAHVNNEWHKKRILLIGHTDDTGSSKLNADLSERRAKEVAQVFKSIGVGENQLYYQGAGETLPIADNATEEGRAKNRRVEIVDLSNEETFKLYLQNRRPNTAYYRPAEMTGSPMRIADNSKSDAVTTASKTKSRGRNKDQAQKVVKIAKPGSPAIESAISQPKPATGYIDFGGLSATQSNTTVSLGELAKAKRDFMFISEAQANDMGAITGCNKDRPRNSGVVKSFKDGKAYATSDYLPGMYGRSWQDTVGGNLVMLNGVAVLRDGAAPANAPTLKVYANYDPVKNRNPKPDVVMNPSVNTYQGSNGLLYRVFTQGEHGIQCMDVLMPSDGSPTAKAGKVIYGSKGNEFVSNFKPTMIN